jgi:hypothetical protein
MSRDSRTLRIFVPGKFLLETLDLFIGAMLKVDELVAGLLRAANELVELQLDGFAISILTVLNEEDGKERHQRRSGIYDQLPRIGVMEKRTSGSPNDHGQRRHDKG